MGTLCYVELNNSGTIFDGNTLLVFGNPGFLGGSGLLNTTPTIPQRHSSSNQLQTRIDNRGGTVAAGQSARITANFSANNPGMKGVYWWDAQPLPNGTFFPDPNALACTAQHQLTAGKTQMALQVTNESGYVFTGSLETIFFDRPDATDATLAEKLLSGDVQGFLPTNQDVVQKVGGAEMQGKLLSLPAGSSLKVQGAPNVLLKGGGRLRAAAVLKITGRDGERFDGLKYVVIGDNDLDC